MGIYTKTGDTGETSLFSGGRVSKDNLRIEAYGTLDELNAAIGLLRSEGLSASVDEPLFAVQETLFVIGGLLADPGGRLSRDPELFRTEPLERWIDGMLDELAPLTSFVLPGGCRAASQAHVARTVCRRAERRIAAVAGEMGDVPEGVLAYVNRLSDALFVVARYLNMEQGAEEPIWESSGARKRS